MSKCALLCAPAQKMQSVPTLSAALPVGLAGTRKVASKLQKTMSLSMLRSCTLVAQSTMVAAEVASQGWQHSVLLTWQPRLLIGLHW